MDYHFTPAQEAFRSELRAFLAGHLPAEWKVENDREGMGEAGLEFSRRFAHALGERGWLTMSWPDYASLAARLLGPKWPFLLTVHLYYFTPETMTALLRRTGFAPLGYKPYLQTLELGYVAQRAAPYLGPLARVLTGPLRVLGLQRLPFQYWVGQTLVVARKASPPA